MAPYIIPLIPVWIFFFSPGFDCASVHARALAMDVSLVLFCLLAAAEFSSTMGSKAHRLVWETVLLFSSSGQAANLLLCRSFADPSTSSRL